MKLGKIRAATLFHMGLVLTGMAMFSPSADAGGFFRRVFCGPCYQQPQYAAPAQGSTPSTQYQSNSYEPGTTPAAAAAPRAAGSGSQYNGVYRVQPGSSVPNMFRADRKILGLQSN